MWSLIEKLTIETTNKLVLPCQHVEVEAMIKNAVERELLKYGIDRNLNNSRIEVAQSSSRANNPVIDDVGPSNVYSNRVTHFIANNGNNDQNRSRENNCPDPAALAKQTQPGPDPANCHMATEMGLPTNGNKENKTANAETRMPNRRIPEFLSGNTCMTLQMMFELHHDHSRPTKQRKSLFNYEAG